MKTINKEVQEFIDKYLEIPKTDPRQSLKAEQPKESWENVLINLLDGKLKKLHNEIR